MSANETEQQLKACIKTALERYGFAPPKTPDTNITDPCDDAATDAVMRALAAEGWRLSKAVGDWRDDPDPDALEAMLRSTIRFPIQMARKPPRKRSETEIARYHTQVAEGVIKNFLYSWTLAPAQTLLKKPPLPPPGWAPNR